MFSNRAGFPMFDWTVESQNVKEIIWTPAGMFCTCISDIETG